MIPGNGEDEYDSNDEGYCGNDYPDDDISYRNNSNYDNYREDAIPHDGNCYSGKQRLML